MTYTPGTYSDYKSSVRFTTTASITLSGLGTQAGGDWSASLTAGDRILVKDQGSSANGIYTAASGAWARATDSDQNLEITPGMMVTVEEGTTSADTTWIVTNDGSITIGSTTITFAQISGSGSADYTSDYKASVRVASPAANISISSPGAAIDSVSLSAGDRVLLKDQTTPSENGIYVWNGAATPMTRADDADIDSEVTAGLLVSVEEGSFNGNSLWMLTTDNPITVGSTALTFTEVLAPRGTASSTGQLIYWEESIKRWVVGTIGSSVKLRSTDQTRIFIPSGGEINFGSSGVEGSTDTRLLRGAPNMLATTNTALGINNGANVSPWSGYTSNLDANQGTSSFSLDIGSSGNTRPGFSIAANGTVSWGDGTLAHDVTLYRSAADVLQTDDRINSTRAVAGNTAFSSRVTGDVQSRMAWQAGGQVIWGDGVVLDTNLYRSAPNTLSMGAGDYFQVQQDPEVDNDVTRKAYVDRRSWFGV